MCRPRWKQATIIMRVAADDDRYRLPIEFGRVIEPMPATLVRGWVYLELEADPTPFPRRQQCRDPPGNRCTRAFRRAGQVCGRGCGDGLAAVLAPFGFTHQLSSNRSQGIPNMIALAQNTARRIA